MDGFTKWAQKKLEFNIISYTKNSMENIDRRFELSNKFTEMGMALIRRRWRRNN
jgi:hypothetical protein